LEPIKAAEQYIERILDSLHENGMSQIDFDQLRQWLIDQRKLLQSTAKDRSEIEILRTDYRKRIAGMVKAMVAVDRKRSAAREALELIESLESMTAAELVACYRKTSARFRDKFPTSFGGLFTRTTNAEGAGDLSVFK
jgi:hypothetical protein